MSKFKSIIVCAANRFDVYKDDVFIQALTLADAGHFLKNMQDGMRLLRDAGYTLVPVDDESRGQGFLDHVGNYHNRKEAYQIATKSGQPLNRAYAFESDEELDSSCLRHLPHDVSWEQLLDCNFEGKR